MRNVRRHDEAAFLRALPAIGLLRQPLDGFPNGRFIPRATCVVVADKHLSSYSAVRAS